MSPKIHEEQGFRFIIYYNDHPPAHVHVMKDDEECKIGLDPVELVVNYGMKPRNIRKALEITARLKVSFQHRWDEIYPPS